MEAVQLAISQYEREARIRQYQSDTTLEMFRKIMFRIHSLATPRIVINIKYPDESVFEIDEKSQTQIDYWKQKMEEYILSTYSDILTIKPK